MNSKRARDSDADMGCATVALMVETERFLSERHPETALAKAWDMYYATNEGKCTEAEFIAFCKQQDWWLE